MDDHYQVGLRCSEEGEGAGRRGIDHGEGGVTVREIKGGGG